MDQDPKSGYCPPVNLISGQFVEHCLWSICPEADNLSPLKNFIKTGAWPRSIEAAIEAGNKLCLGEATTPFSIWILSV